MLAIIVKVVHLFVCFGLIVLVLFQADKGEGLAGAFGGGASSTVFGERGSGGFLSKLTTSLAIIFMVTSLVISIKGADWDKEAAMESFSPNTVQTNVMPDMPMSMPMDTPITGTSEVPPVTAVPAPAVSSNEPVKSPVTEAPAPVRSSEIGVKSVPAPSPVAPIKLVDDSAPVAPAVEEAKAQVSETVNAVVEEKKAEANEAAKVPEEKKAEVTESAKVPEEKKAEATDKADNLMKENNAQTAEQSAQ